MSPRLVVLIAVPVLLALAGCASKGSKSHLANSSIAPPAEQSVSGAPSAPSDAEDAPLPHDPIANQAPIPLAALREAPVVPVGFEPVRIEAAPEAERSYLLDSGDRVRVFVYGQPSLSRTYTIDGNGFIAMPLVGAVRARGLTTYDLSEQVGSLLRTQYVRDPVVTAEITQYRQLYVMGEVRNAGGFAYVPGMTVQTAVATAGGYSPRAYTRSAKLTRMVDGELVELDVPAGYRVQPGDTILIEERFF